MLIIGSEAATNVSSVTEDTVAIFSLNIDVVTSVFDLGAEVLKSRG
jgi:hypothetical protein